MTDGSEFAIETARAAGAVLMQWFRSELTVETKSNTLDLVTEADRASESLVIERIRAAYPEHGILAEESGQVRDHGALTWIVDPLDGTTNFAHGYPHYCVSLALYRGTQGRLGVVHDPVRAETFVAERGHGAWLVDASGTRERLRVSTTASVAQALLETGFAYDFKTTGRDNLAEFVRLLRRARAVRRAGSAALALAYVAAGRLDGFWEFHLGPWDTAAGAVLVGEAGGQVRSIAPDDAGAWDPWRDGVVAANPALLLPLIEALHA